MHGLVLPVRTTAIVLTVLGLAACGGAAPSPSAKPSQPASSGPPASVAAAASSASSAAASKTAGASTTGTATGKPINVSVIQTFTGKFAPIGQSSLEGAQVAANEINANGGIMGRPVHLISVNAVDAVDAVPAVRQMLATDNVKLIVGFEAPNYQNALPIANAAKVVSFTNIGDPALDHVQMPYSFRMTPSDAVVGTAMAVYAKKKGYTKIATVFDAEQGAQTLIPPIEAAAKALGITIVAKPAIPSNVTSYEAEILQIIQAKPDAILTQIDPPVAGIFFKQLRSLGGQNIPVIGSDYTANLEWTKAAGGAAIAPHLTSIVSADDTTGDAGKYFVAAYQKAYNHPPRTWAVHFYDGLNVGALAMVDAKSVDPATYVSKILDVTTPGADHTVIHDFKDGTKLLAEGKKVKYSGVGSPMTYSKYHTVTGGFQAITTDPNDGHQTTVGQISASDLQQITGD